MKTYRIVVLPGDGIGPEIVEGALEVLEKLQNHVGDFRLEYDFQKAGASCYEEIFFSVARESPEIDAESLYVDAASAALKEELTTAG